MRAPVAATAAAATSPITVPSGEPPVAALAAEPAAGAVPPVEADRSGRSLESVADLVGGPPPVGSGPPADGGGVEAAEDAGTVSSSAP